MTSSSTTTTTSTGSSAHIQESLTTIEKKVNEEVKLAVELAADLTSSDPNDSYKPYELLLFVALSTFVCCLICCGMWVFAAVYGARAVKRRFYSSVAVSSGSGGSSHEHDDQANDVSRAEEVHSKAAAVQPPPVGIVVGGRSAVEEEEERGERDRNTTTTTTTTSTTATALESLDNLMAARAAATTTTTAAAVPPPPDLHDLRAAHEERMRYILQSEMASVGHSVGSNLDTGDMLTEGQWRRYGGGGGYTQYTEW